MHLQHRRISSIDVEKQPLFWVSLALLWACAVRWQNEMNHLCYKYRILEIFRVGLIFNEFATSLKLPKIDTAKNKPYYTSSLKVLEMAKIGLSENLTHLPSAISAKFSQREKFPIYGILNIHFPWATSLNIFHRHIIKLVNWNQSSTCDRSVPMHYSFLYAKFCWYILNQVEEKWKGQKKDALSQARHMDMETKCVCETQINPPVSTKS